METQSFQVDLHGVIDLLSRHIYSSPQVYLRELLQNGRDAVTARSQFDPAAPVGRLRLVPAGPGQAFVFRDNGIGLTAAEAAEMLATVGRSSKRDEVLGLPREGYLGQFGIGLLSCFMVTDAIVVRSRSARGGPAIEWIGSADGTFTLRELTDQETDLLEVGTEVRLVARHDDAVLLGHDRVRGLARRYAEHLPVGVEVVGPDGRAVGITRRAAYLLPVEDVREELLDLGRELLGATPLDVIELTEPGTGTRGVAFVLPFAPPPGARQATRVTLGGMLLGEHVDGLLPDWAFFVRCVLDTTGLTPTASRESLVADDQLEATRESLGAQLRGWLLRCAATDPARLGRVVAVHHVAMRALAVHDDELARMVIRWLTLETSAGTMTITDHLERYPRVRYTETVDEFRQIAALAAPDQPIVNGGFQYDADLLRRLPELRPDLTDLVVERVTVSAELDELEPPPLSDRSVVLELERRAALALASAGVTVTARVFSPADLPALYVVDPEVLRRIERGKAADVAPGLWAGVLGQLDGVRRGRFGSPGSNDPPPTARLCLNWASGLVRRLAGLSDELVLARTVQLVYVQAVLAGHRPLTRADRGMLTQALADLVELSAVDSEDERR